MDCFEETCNEQGIMKLRGENRMEGAKSMKKIKTAVVGLGRIGWKYHIPAILNHPGFELAAIADPLQDRLSEGMAEFSVRGYADYSELLEREEIDLAVIASPTPFHAEQAINAMNRGVDVLLEKPIASSLEETEKIIGIMNRIGRKMMTYQPHRVSPETQAVKHILARNILGPVYMIKRNVAWFTRRNDWQAYKKNGGGMLNNYGSHYIDQLLYITGARAKKTTVHLRKIASLGDADDVVKIIIETDSGILLDLDINMACAQHLPEWVLMGQFGTAVMKRADDNSAYFDIKYYLKEELGELHLVSDFAAPYRIYGNKDPIPWKKEVLDVSDFQKENYYDKCYDYFALNKPPLVTAAEILELMRIIDFGHKTGW